MKRGTLPIRYEIENTDVAGSSSELKAVCAVVQAAGKIKRQVGSFAAVCNTPISVASGVGEVPVLAIRPAATFKGVTNKVLTVPTEFHVISDASASGIFNVRIRNLCFTNGGSYTGVSTASATEVNHNPTGIFISGVVQYAAPIKGGADYDHSFETFTETRQASLVTSVLSDNTTQPPIVITVEGVSAGATGNFFATMNYDEMVY